MADRLRPGDLRRLSAPALADAGEYAALAALSTSGQHPETAVSALASAAHDEAAFAWLWALVRDQEQRWRAAQLPHTVTVPKDLQQQVTDFIVTAPPAQRQVSLAEDGASRLLTALGQSPIGLLTARLALSDPGAASPRVRQVAIDLLAHSNDHDGRRLVLERLTRTPEHKRAAEFERLQPPYDEDELTAVLVALDFVSDRAIEDGDFPAIAAVAARLPDQSLVDLLASTWRREANKQKLHSGWTDYKDGSRSIPKARRREIR